MRTRALTLRLANVYGPRQDPRGEAGVIAVFMSRLFRRAHCVVNGDGHQTRDFVYVDEGLQRTAAYFRRSVTRDRSGSRPLASSRRASRSDRK